MTACKMADSNFPDFLCHKCGNRFISAVSLSNHKGRIHGRFMCNECKRRYATSWGLKRHIRRNALCSLYYETMEVVDLSSDSDDDQQG